MNRIKAQQMVERVVRACQANGQTAVNGRPIAGLVLTGPRGEVEQWWLDTRTGRALADQIVAICDQLEGAVVDWHERSSIDKTRTICGLEASTAPVATDCDRLPTCSKCTAVLS